MVRVISLIVRIGGLGPLGHHPAINHDHAGHHHYDKTERKQNEKHSHLPSGS